MDDFDRELESIEVAIEQDHELHAVRRRFEESKEWEDHRRWHQDNGGTPVLRVWDEPIPVQPVSTVDESIQEIPHRRAIKVGGCDCQPRTPFMELSDRGDVVAAGIPPPEAAATVYGAAGSAAPSTYGAQGQAENIYNAGPSQQKDLYR